MRYIVANWKLNKKMEDVLKWFEGFKFPQSKNTIIVSPSTPHLHAVKELTEGKGVAVSGQDVSTQEKGAHTGQVSAAQLKDFCTYCIVGHSELKEPKETVLKKRDVCLAQKITPVVCFTDPEEAKDFYTEGSVLAWEDPTNISKNGQYNEKPLSDMEQGMSKIKSVLPKEAVVLYGGSVNDGNAKKLASMENVGGVLVGNASLNPESFAEIIEAFN